MKGTCNSCGKDDVEVQAGICEVCWYASLPPEPDDLAEIEKEEQEREAEEQAAANDNHYEGGEY